MLWAAKKPHTQLLLLPLLPLCCCTRLLHGTQSGLKVVTRPPQYDDDAQLPTYFFRKTGACVAAAAAAV
jgi:hypothetical protein